MSTYRLTSTEMVYTPGLIGWVLSHLSTPKAKRFIKSAYPTLPLPVVHALVAGRYTVEDDTVVVEIQRQKKHASRGRIPRTKPA